MLEPGGVSSCKTVRRNNLSMESPEEGEEAKSREGKTKSLSIRKFVLTVRDCIVRVGGSWNVKRVYLR